MLRKMLSDAQIEKDLLERKHEEVKLQNQQNKELYIFAEESFETEKKMRMELEKSLTSKL